MTKKEPSQVYGGRIPADYLPAHNHIQHLPEFTNGQYGFRRFWIPPQWVDQKGWKPCPCGWRAHDPKWHVHYAGKMHVRNQKARQRGDSASTPTGRMARRT